MIDMKFRDKKELILLLIVLLISAYFAYMPHANYSLPLHRDEWDRITLANALLRYGSTEFPDPFIGEGVISNYPEIGFVIFIPIFKLMGIEWWPLFRYFPIFISVFLTLTTYILARRMGYGIEAAFFVALIPTTVRYLGPAFLVPVSLALPFIILTLYSAFFLKRGKYIIVFLISVFLLYEHPPSAIATFIALFFFILVERDLKMLITILLASLTAIPQFLAYIECKGTEGLVFTAVGIFKGVFIEFGYISTIIFVLGFYLAMRDWKKHEVIITFTVVTLLSLIVLYRFFKYIPLIFPERVLLYTLLFMSILAGKGLNWIKSKSWIVALIISLVIFVLSYQSHANTPYYHIINEEEFEDFMWIRDNLDGKAILDPWKAIAFTAVAEKPVYVTISLGPCEKTVKRIRETVKFFRENCSDTEFLIRNNISIVYYGGSVDNPNLIKVRDKIYYFPLSSLGERK